MDKETTDREIIKNNNKKNKIDKIGKKAEQEKIHPTLGLDNKI